MKLGVRTKLFLTSLVLIALVGLASGVYLERALRGWLVARIEADLHQAVSATQTLLDTALEAHPDQRISEADSLALALVDPLADRMGEATATRVTVIAPGGRVLGDSSLPLGEVAGLDNHANRPEVREALSSKEGVSQRYSTTVEHRMMYVARAWPVPGGDAVIRASVPLQEIDESVGTVRIILGLASLVGLAVAVFISALASHLLGRTLRQLVDYVRSLSQGESSMRPPLSDDDEMLDGLAGSLTRLSDELSHTVDALAQERDRFAAVLENMAEAVLAIDDRRRITLVNHAAYELLELDEDPVGRPVVEVLRAPGFQELLDQAESGHRASQEFALNLATTKRVLAQAAPTQDTVGTVVVMHDVTELRRLETMRRDFVANVSHELRTPVSVIRATAETLQDGALEDPKHAPRFLDALIRNSERLGRLIADLLDISRIEAGEYGIELEPVALAPAAERAVETVAAQAAKRDIDLFCDIGDEARVQADPKALDQVLLNLVGNAVKYSAQGGTVVVRARSIDDQVVVEVEDDGPGIALAHRDRIFERFYRVDSGRSREVGGTGLGLSIVKHLVTTMGGQVGYEAGSPRGSIFWFILPRA